MLRPALTAALFFSFIGTVSAHLGSPWHGTGTSVALGFNTIYLEVPEGEEQATFKVKYPIQENTFDYRVGNTTSLVVFSNDELSTQGFITEESAVLAVDNGPYDPNQPSTYEFSIEKSGFYHVLFGPGPNTSILVLQSSRTIDVQPTSPGARTGEWLAPATSGDFHIIKHPTKGLGEFAGWYSVFYDEFTEVYKENNLPIASEMDLIGERADGFAAALAERGYPQFSDFSGASQIATSPFLGNVNGLKSAAFDTAFLNPGQYTFSYRPNDIKSTIVQTNEISLEVFADSAFEKQYGLDKDIIASQSFIANRDEYSLEFEITAPGFYHLSYSVGEGGFLFQMVEDESLPTSLSSASGGLVPLTRMTGVNSVIVSEKPFEEGAWSVFFPCKVVRAKEHGAPSLNGISVPFTRDTRLEVARFGSAVMLPLTSEFYRNEIERQRLKLQLIQNGE